MASPIEIVIDIRRHKIDLADPEPIFDSPMITVEDTRAPYGEPRLRSLGSWGNRVVFLIWTPRGDETAHLISRRYANRTQTEAYFSAV
ncbi:MAG: BrnT family toxin [Burkholderiales bacterium]|nr:BrnT family toxin [Burkholderiales bacterium]